MQNNALFNTYAISVSKQWANLKQKERIESLKLKCKGNNKREIENLKNEKLDYTGGLSVFSCGLNLFLLDSNINCAFYLIESAIIILDKVKKSEISEDEKIQNTVNEKYKNSSLAIACGKRLEFYVSLACAKSMKTLEIPKKDDLEKEIVKLNNTYKLYKGNLGYSERQDSVIASVVSLLIGRYDISLELLDRCKKYKEMKRHRQILRKITIELINKPEHSSTILNTSIESDFFELFNAYRLPIWFQTNDALKEPPILDNPVGNYIFTWLYLYLFKGQTKTSREELQDIMTS